MQSEQVINGSCHCGNIRFRFRRTPGDIVARRCGCSFCQKRGGIWTSDPNGSLRLEVSDPSALNRYRFGTATAEFFICGRCGICPVVVCDIDDVLYAVVSVSAMDELSGINVVTSASDFSDEQVDDRLARRRKNWIGQVEVVDESGASIDG